MEENNRKLNIRKVLILILILVILFLLILCFYKNKHNETTETEATQQVSAEQKNNEENEQGNNEENKQENEQENKETTNGENNAKNELLENKIASGKILGEEGLPILMYHFFYDKKTSSGKDGNWIEISKFEEQIKYLAENDFYFPTWKEVEDYIDNNQELPEKSVVITVDDGDPSFFELAVPIIQKYKVPVTSFLVTYWYGDRANNKQEYVSYQSHSYDMHKSGENGKGVMLSWDYDKIKEDVLLSKEVLGGANIFCYPFGQYNDLDIQVLKENGYNLALTTESGRVKKGTAKYALPRVRVDKNTSFNEFKKKVQ